MLTSLAIPAIVILISFPGLGGLPGFRFKRTPPPPADSLPPAWKHASMLALENQFVRGSLPSLAPSTASLGVAADPRRLRVSFDPDSGVLSSAPEMGEVSVGMATRVPLGDYSRDLTRRNFRRQWAERSRQNINVLGTETAAAPRSGLSFQLPSPLPRRVQSLLGPGGPALNVSGSEIIRLSGTSNWTNQQVGPLGQKRSLFPSLDMQQDLDIRLEGQLSDRVRVNLLQNSGVQIPLANRIAINYKGDEDDLIQSLDLGNTSLTLPGTQYVSYSGKNEGLFGVKVASRLGPLDFTLLTSKQEGRSERASYAGGSSRQPQTLRDHEYTRGVYFFLYDPNGPTYDIPDESIRLYLDDGNSTNDVNTIRGVALVDPDSAGTEIVPSRGPYSLQGSYALLTKGADQDYEIMRDVYGPNFKVIQLKRPMNPGLKQSLAVTYQRRPVNLQGRYATVGERDTVDSEGATAKTMKLLWVPPDRMRTGDFFEETLAFTALRELELKNFYQLAGQRIDPTSLKITIRKGVDQPPVENLNTQQGAIPYIEVLGLDNFDETTNTPIRGHDHVVDGTFAADNTRFFVDYVNGTLFFFDLRPFDPRISGHPRPKPFEEALSSSLNRRANLAEAGAGNPNAYDKYNLQRDLDAEYYIDLEFTAARAGGEINLGRSNLVEGSDVVTVSGETWVRDRDYTIDYDLGRIVLKRQLKADSQLNIDYSYAPLFQQAGKTLIGSAFRLEGRDRSFGGAFLYESKGAQDLRPRLGEEPSRSLIGDLNTEWTFRPEWMTRMVDRLPGVRTTTGSEFHAQAEVGASFPNPNTRNEVFIDDMEGVRDGVGLSMGPERWRWSSVPSRATSVVAGRAQTARSFLELMGQTNAELHWYSPYAVVQEKDLKPNLTDAQGRQNTRQVLALSIPRRPLTASPSDTMWAGLTYPLDVAGLDLSKSQFIELWVNDFQDVQRIRGPGVRLHIDLGTVSEDQMRAPDVPPNNRLDSEDQEPRDNQLVVSSAKNEDTGVDGRETIAERDSVPPPYRDLVTASSLDPQGDDFAKPNEDFKEIDPRRYVFTNGTEGNKVILPIPDTEDLDLSSGPVNTQENYFEYTIDLGDTTVNDSSYLVTNVQAEFPNVEPDKNGYPNGWRRYRIPIASTRRVQFGAPDLTRVPHVRI